MEYKAIIAKFFMMSDILFAAMAVLLQRNIRTFKEGSDLAVFVSAMTFFTLKIIFLIMDEDRKSRKEKREEVYFEEYKKDVQEYLRKKDEIRENKS